MRHLVLAIVLLASACSLYAGDDTNALDAGSSDARRSPTWTEIACIRACDLDDGLSRCGDEGACEQECERGEPGAAYCPCGNGACDPLVTLCEWLCVPERALCAGADVAACVVACVAGDEDGDGALCTGSL